MSSERILSIFDHATLKNYISAVIYSSISSYTSLERVTIKLLEKKIFRSQGTHNILHKKKKTRHIFRQLFVKKLKSVILPEKLYILCNTVQLIFFLQYLSKTARISVENIERLTIFYKFIL